MDGRVRLFWPGHGETGRSSDPFAEPGAAAAAAGLALGERGHALGQCRHDGTAFVGCHADPASDLTARAPAADAEPGFGIDDADSHTGAFDARVAEIIHERNLGRKTPEQSLQAA